MTIHSRSSSIKASLAFGILLLNILLAQSVRAAGPWYVAPGGSDSNSCLSAGSPCATINGAIGKAASGDTIYVATGVYTNSTGSEVVLIDQDITLSGGWDVAFTTQTGMSTVDGEGARQGIAVNSGIIATIEGFVIQDGSTEYGGGIYTEGTLTLKNSTVSSNTSQYSGGGIFNIGILTLNNSTVSGNTSQSSGGGIWNNSGTITLNNSTVSGNTSQNNAGGGIINLDTMTFNNSSVSSNTSQGDIGGIFNDGTLTLNNSTVSGNTSVAFGGGIWNTRGTVTLNNSTVSGNISESDVGGIFNIGILTLNNSTVSGNTSQTGNFGGIYNGSGTVTLHNSTVSSNTSQTGNFGGIYNSEGTMTLKNSILAGNSASGSGPDCTGDIVSSGYNLIGNTTGCTFTASTGDLLNINPMLFPLIVSLGVHPLLPWSPAINAGNPAGCTDNLGNPLNTDQRGVAHVGRCDIGAYEYDPNYDPLSYMFLPLIVK